MLVGWTAPAFSQPDPAMASIDALVKERKRAMKTMSRGMKALGRLVRGERIWRDTEALKATAILMNECQRLPDLFPPGSDHRRSRAVPEIWTDGGGFEAVAGTAWDAMADIEKAIRNGDRDMVRDGWYRMDGICKTCHDLYREK